MTLRHRWIVLAALALLRGNFPSHAEDFPLDEYEEHVNRYLAGTEGIAVDLTFEGCTTDGKTFTPSIDEFSFVSIPGYSRTKWKQDVNSKVATTQWLLRRPDGNFQIIQNGPKSFALEQSSQASSATSYRFTPFDVLTGPISGYRYALISELRGTTGDGHCHIVSFERHRGEGGTGSTLHLKDDLNEFEIDFNDQWLITRNKRVLLDTGWTGTYEMAYGNFEGRVVPLGSTSRFNDPALQEQWPTMHATFTNYRLFNGTAEDFSLKQFGIPDPGQATKPPAPSRWYLWFLLGGALSAGVAVFFWYRVKRRKARLA